MAESRPQPDPVDHLETIQPTAYQPPTGEAARAPALKLRRSTVFVAVVLALTALFAAFLLSAKSVLLALQPASADIHFDGGFSLQLGERVLLRKGFYTALVSAEGYEQQSIELAVDDSEQQSLSVSLEKLPGLLRVITNPTDAQVLIDGAPMFVSNAEPASLAAGSYTLGLATDRFLPFEQALVIEGMGIEQQLEVTLTPAWGTYSLDTIPSGAQVLVDQQPVGDTPIDLELLQGERAISISLAGHESLDLVVDATAGETRVLDTPTLRLADGQLTVKSRPSAANITVNGEFRGKTPLTLALRSGTAYTIDAFKAGYHKRAVSLELDVGEQKALTLDLRPVTGEVNFRVSPAQAEIWLDGRRLGEGNQDLELPATRQSLEIRASGYASQTIAVTPRPGFPQTLRVRLLTEEEQRIASIKPRINSPDGGELQLLRPTPFTMGASRREPGRRANETLREVPMKRSFYLARNEVTNAQFRKFVANHNSGNFKGKSLNGENQPVVNVSWQQAALYCNWLSAQEGLEPFYTETAGTVTGFVAASNGYRLPTEAEWAWAARVQADGSVNRFSWGNTLPPKGKAGNFADESAANLLGEFIAKYNDGHAVAAPVGSYPPDRHGLYDLSGNAAEWMHDFYETTAGLQRSEVDPVGPSQGSTHLIRGPSWRHGALTEIRLSFRDWGADPRPDVGFRIARYL